MKPVPNNGGKSTCGKELLEERETSQNSSFLTSWRHQVQKAIIIIRRRWDFHRLGGHFNLHLTFDRSKPFHQVPLAIFRKSSAQEALGHICKFRKLAQEGPGCLPKLHPIAAVAPQREE
eukprot:symbB.v1.2.025146.t1/scaffold2426.1/size79499/2